MRLCLIQEFNKGIFDYLIATDDPAKRLEQEERLARKPAVQPEPAPTRGRGRGKDKADQRKRKRASENDSEFGVIRGIDFQGVTTVINVDVPDSVQVTPLAHPEGKKSRCIPSCSSRCWVDACLAGKNWKLCARYAHLLLLQNSGR